jgi:hypothetical protein
MCDLTLHDEKALAREKLGEALAFVCRGRHPQTTARPIHHHVKGGALPRVKLVAERASRFFDPHSYLDRPKSLRASLARDPSDRNQVLAPAADGERLGSRESARHEVLECASIELPARLCHDRIRNRQRRETEAQ